MFLLMMLLKAIFLQPDTEEAGNAIFLEGKTIPSMSLFDIIGEAAGKKRILVNLPAGLMKGIVRNVMFIFKNHRSPLLQLPMDWLDKYLNNWIMSSDKAVKELGYKITPLAEGVSRTLKWLKSNTGWKRKIIAVQ